MAGRGKSKFVMVWIKSLVTGHKVVAIRPRNNDKLEVLRYDPFIEQYCVYKEAEKIRGAKY